MDKSLNIIFGLPDYTRQANDLSLLSTENLQVELQHAVEVYLGEASRIGGVNA